MSCLSETSASRSIFRFTTALAHFVIPLEATIRAEKEVRYVMMLEVATFRA